MIDAALQSVGRRLGASKRERERGALALRLCRKAAAGKSIEVRGSSYARISFPSSMPLSLSHFLMGSHLLNTTSRRRYNQLHQVKRICQNSE